MNLQYDDYFFNHSSFSNFNKKTILIAGHQRLGDQISTIGLVRFLAKYYENVYLLTTMYKNYVTSFYSDLSNINFISPQEINKFQYDKKLILGLNNPKTDHNLFAKLPLNWYIQSELDVNIMWDFFHIPNLYNNDQADNLYNIIKNKEFILTNVKSSTGIAFDVKDDFDILNESTIFIDININLYPSTHKYYDICNKFINRNFLEYVKLIQEAKMILLTDSALFCLVLHIQNIKSSKIILYTRDRSYKHIFEQKKSLKLLFEEKQPIKKI